MRTSSAVAVFALAAIACASESTTEPEAPPPATRVEAPADTTPKDPPNEQKDSVPNPTPETPPAPPAPPVVLVAPIIDVMQTVPKGIKIGWYNAPDCEAIVGEVKTGLASYYEVFSVPNTETFTIDTTPMGIANHGSMQFTYRLRCKKGTTLSPYSNELSAFGPS
jgi:hypothetical protein